MKFVVASLFVVASTLGAGRQEGEGTSLLGQPLGRIELEGERRQHYEDELLAARARWGDAQAEIDAIWVGRHLAYLGRYRDAIDWYTARLADFPESVRLRRHRGHRYLSVRRLDDAITDLARAWELAEGTEDAVEPDGAPNELGIPRSTTHTNVLYHLGLAHYLKGDFARAAEVYLACIERCTNDDMLVATLNWYVHALRRAGKALDGPELTAALDRARTEMDVIENHAYHRLLLLQKGAVTIDTMLATDADGVQNATRAYGVANWMWADGDRLGARRMWQRIVAETPWNAFGHLAAEAELLRLRN